MSFLSDLVSTEVLYAGYALLAIGAPYMLLKGRSKSSKGEIHEGKKQGGYGKIPVFQPKLLRSLLTDPKGLMAVVKFKTGCGLPGVKKGKMPTPADFQVPDGLKGTIDEDIVFCGVMLDKVSRSFAAVIRQLPVGLALPVCVFYLVLRALDTVEDDMDLSKFKIALQSARGPEAGDAASIGDEEARDFKFKCLTHFHTLLLDGLTGTEVDKTKSGNDAGSEFFSAATIFSTLSTANVGEKDEATLFKQFDRVVRVFSCCSAAQQSIIADITQKMAAGMAEYINRDLSDKGTNDIHDYNQYCHYVAGLVGEGLSRLWATTPDGCKGLPKATVDQLRSERGLNTLSSDMGLFLQKTNIIRDYLEDILDQRAFWPKEVWGQYVKRLGDLKEADNISQAVACLNHLVCDALEKVPSCLQYLELLGSGPVQVLRFCAIPQVMAIATLLELYGNPLVFKGVVKISKVQAVRVVIETGTMEGIKQWFRQCIQKIRRKAIAWTEQVPLPSGSVG